MSKDNSVHFSSESVDWWTPPEWLTVCHDVFNANISLDPCSNDLFTAGADHAFAWRDNGRARKWDYDYIYMNPEYGRNIALWTQKHNEEARNYKACISLLPARVDTQWFHNLDMDAICFIEGRIKFIDGLLVRMLYNQMPQYMRENWFRFTTSSAPFPSILTLKVGDKASEGEAVWLKHRFKLIAGTKGKVMFV